MSHLATTRALVGMGFRRPLAYPSATWAGLIANGTFALIQMYLVLAVLRGHHEIARYDEQAIVAYAWLAQGYAAITSLWEAPPLAERIRSGDITVDLARPVDIQLAALATELGRAGYQLLFRAAPIIALGALVFAVQPAGVAALSLSLASLVLATAVSFAFRFAYGTTTFWLVHERGAITVAVLAASLFSGLVVPIGFFPSWLRSIVELTPFPSMLQTPIDLFVGRIDGAAAAGALLLQAGWCAALLLIGRAAFERGRVHLSLRGG